MSYSLATIADMLEAGLREAARGLDEEQAVSGLDGREEVDLHPLLARILDEAGYGVHREQRYPADRRKRSETEGERCDLVLTPDGLPLKKPDAEPTLFDPADAVDLDLALWLEVKVVAQFRPEGPNANYASHLLSAVWEDVAKLAKDPGIRHAALLVLLFVAEPAVADHDLGVWEDRCLARGLPIGPPCRRGFELADRHGNCWCALALYGVMPLVV